MPHFTTATFAAGCFWCTEAIFKRLAGVQTVVSGYTGGDVPNPTYDQVGSTGHTEAIQLTFDPQVISYDTLLDIFWHTHNPTTLDRQGADAGPQYRSVIYYHSPDQQAAAIASKTALGQSGEYSSPIVTDILPATEFYPAENYHQNYYDSQPTAPYCSIVISPKLKKLIEKYSSHLKPEYLA